MSIRVTGLFIYPVKGARGIALAESEITPRGFAYDRRFLVVDAHGDFQTQREEPRLARLETSIAAATLTLRYGELGAVTLPLSPEAGDEIPVTIWGDKVVAQDAGSEAAALLTRAFGHPLRLAYMPDSAERVVQATYARPEDRVSFADAFPYLLANEASLVDLNSRLGAEAVPMDRFRPNIVVAGAPAFAEHDWPQLSVGTVPFDAPKPCVRCLVTTTDQYTGERKGKEPLRTLAGYRTWDGKATFGQNLIARGLGTLRLGDPVCLLSGPPAP